jgi:transposase
MAYSIDYRKRVLEYIDEGHTYAQAQEVFKIGSTTIKEWKKLLSETGTLEKRPLKRNSRVYESDKLCAYMEENPQALLKEVAAHFGGSISGANSALERAKITLKKRRLPTPSEMKKKERNLTLG